MGAKLLIYVDESGDPGLKFGSGSSELLLVSAALFQSEEDAAACDRRIVAVRKTLRLPETAEFRFAKASAKVRLGFLEAVAGQKFSYLSVVIHKRRLLGSDFEGKEALYQKAVGLAFHSLRPHLEGAFVEIDRSGGQDFGRRLNKYLSGQLAGASKTKLIKHVKMAESRTSNRIQLADMICGAVGRSMGSSNPDDRFRELIRRREIEVIEWP
jgi:hypothetical protein